MIVADARTFSSAVFVVERSLMLKVYHPLLRTVSRA
jgi:hypothetical protein